MYCEIRSHRWRHSGRWSAWGANLLGSTPVATLVIHLLGRVIIGGLILSYVKTFLVAYHHVVTRENALFTIPGCVSTFASSYDIILKLLFSLLHARMILYSCFCCHFCKLLCIILNFLFRLLQAHKQAVRLEWGAWNEDNSEGRHVVNIISAQQRSTSSYHSVSTF